MRVPEMSKAGLKSREPASPNCTQANTWSPPLFLAAQTHGHSCLQPLKPGGEKHRRKEDAFMAEVALSFLCSL